MTAWIVFVIAVQVLIIILGPLFWPWWFSRKDKP